MTLVPTNAQNYYVGTTFTYPDPITGDPVIVAIPLVDDVDEDYKATPKYLSGDDAPGPRVKVNFDEMRELVVSTSAIRVLKTIPRGVIGTFVTKRPDSLNGIAAGGGGQLITLANCSLHATKWSGKHNDYAKAQAHFSAFWTQTSNAWVDPLTVVDL